MNTVKIIFKVVLTFVLFVVLLQVFRGIGITALNYSSIDTSVTFGANIEASVSIFSFLLALFLSVKSYQSRKYLKWIVLGGLVPLFTILVISVVTTKIILQNDVDSNISVEILKNQKG
jgi:F0F1-type ATP synthase membrane subunit a